MKDFDLIDLCFRQLDASQQAPVELIYLVQEYLGDQNYQTFIANLGESSINKLDSDIGYTIPSQMFDLNNEIKCCVVATSRVVDQKIKQLCLRVHTYPIYNVNQLKISQTAVIENDGYESSLKCDHMVAQVKHTYTPNQPYDDNQFCIIDIPTILAALRSNPDNNDGCESSLRIFVGIRPTEIKYNTGNLLVIGYIQPTNEILNSFTENFTVKQGENKLFPTNKIGARSYFYDNNIYIYWYSRISHVYAIDGFVNIFLNGDHIGAVAIKFNAWNKTNKLSYNLFHNRVYKSILFDNKNNSDIKFQLQWDFILRRETGDSIRPLSPVILPNELTLPSGVTHIYQYNKHAPGIPDAQYNLWYGMSFNQRYLNDGLNFWTRGFGDNTFALVPTHGSVTITANNDCYRIEIKTDTKNDLYNLKMKIQPYNWEYNGVIGGQYDSKLEIPTRLIMSLCPTLVIIEGTITALSELTSPIYQFASLKNPVQRTHFKNIITPISKDEGAVKQQIWSTHKSYPVTQRQGVLNNLTPTSSEDSSIDTVVVFHRYVLNKLVAPVGTGCVVVTLYVL